MFSIQMRLTLRMPRPSPSSISRATLWKMGICPGMLVDLWEELLVLYIKEYFILMEASGYLVGSSSGVAIRLGHDEIMRYLWKEIYQIGKTKFEEIQVNPRRVHSLLLIIPILASILHYG
ncbi:hypothetical protein CY34DRAFT_172125 [Suillus luteus UH-Slu-Lm8-n1]|uniref:Uncharacterized protein n=1 Tax=Suillus luteus UH-Slu-Lm8-n1 TaxID=930992 RepID=A0A0D0B697_9AGAM|nr:hypothetical protein CY34DRAFT_172125 [Suillus luteus UH-Slu-Lm8-n1]